MISILNPKKEALEAVNKMSKAAKNKETILSHFLNFENVKIPKSRKGIFVARFAAKILTLPVFPVNFSNATNKELEFESSMKCFNSKRHCRNMRIIKIKAILLIRCNLLNNSIEMLRNKQNVMSNWVKLIIDNE